MRQTDIGDCGGEQCDRTQPIGQRDGFVNRITASKKSNEARRRVTAR